MKKLFAEFLGTFLLIVLGCGAVVLGGYGNQNPAGVVAIAFAFGLSVTFMVYTFGKISGGHFNPAVSTAMLVAGRINKSDYVKYLLAQFLGAIVGALFLTIVLSAKKNGYDIQASGLGQNSTTNYGIVISFIVEVLATFIFTTVILNVTSDKTTGNLAGLIIGLTLFVLILVFLNITGLSVNPARSFGPAIFVGGAALNDLWVFFVAPILGAILSGLVAKTKILS